MALIIGGPKFQALDNNGVPISGGLVWSYVSGTTTLKDTYPSLTDAKNQTNANDNPVILDSRGEADITTNGSTKLILEYPPTPPAVHGVEIWTKDDIDTASTDIFDPNGNEVLKFAYVSSAVNEWTMTNAATGNGPILASTGGDVNIDLNINPKGGGVVRLASTTGNNIISSTVGNVSLTTTSGNVAVTTTTGNFTASIPSTGTIALATTGSGTATIQSATGNAIVKSTAADVVLDVATGHKAYYSINGTPKEILTAAVQADQETGTSNILGVTPGVQHYHQSAAKFWCKATGTGSAISASYNVTSITDNGAGDLTVTIANDFSSANYSATVSIDDTSGGVRSISCIQSSAGAVRLTCLNGSGVPTDPNASYSVVGYGDQ